MTEPDPRPTPQQNAVGAPDDPRPGEKEPSGGANAAGEAPTASQPRALWRGFAVIALAALAGAAVGAFALYGMNRPSGNAASPAESGQSVSAPAKVAAATDKACAAAVTRAGALAPFAKGEIAAFTLASEPRRLPDLSFADKDGKAMSLQDFRGKVALVNLWATWCVPCRKEMPALDALQRDLGGDDFQVVAINLDTRDPDKPHAFLKEIGIRDLAFYQDAGTKSFQALRAVGRGFGLPTTLLVDKDGCELGFLAGPAEWGGADAKALVRAALGDGKG